MNLCCNDMRVRTKVRLETVRLSFFSFARDAFPHLSVQKFTADHTLILYSSTKEYRRDEGAMIAKATQSEESLGNRWLELVQREQHASLDVRIISPG